MARLPDVLGSLDAEAKKVYDRIASKRGRIGGPFAALMHHPPLAERVAAVGEYLRYDATLPGRWWDRAPDGTLAVPAGLGIGVALREDLLAARTERVVMRRV